MRPKHHVLVGRRRGAGPVWRPAAVAVILCLALVAAIPATAQQRPEEPPRPPQPPGQPQAPEETQAPIPLPELKVPGLLEQSYVVRQTTTGTKTDTPLIETPQSISVITRDRMDAQNVTSVAEALLYMPGVSRTEQDSRIDFFFIRGFDQSVTGLYRDELQLKSNALGFFRFDPYGAERIELLRGPTSVLYGQNSPGGIVNIVTKRPTAVPFREVELQVGSFDRFQGAFDLSGPVRKDGTLLYRLTGLARDSDTQVDFVEDDRLFIAPALTWRPSANTTLTILSHYQYDRTGSTQFLPASGTLLDNPNGKIPTSRFAGEPGFEGYDRTQYSIGYLFEHRASDAWTFRQNPRYDHLDVDYETVFGFSLQADQRTLNRFALATEPKTDAFTIDTQAQAKFATGPLGHTVLVGVDYQRYVFDNRLGFIFIPTGAPPIDIFDPVYGQPVTRPAFTTNTKTVQDQVGLYLQDQVKLFKRWVLALGGRYDWARSETDDRNTGTSIEQDDSEFTGRAGLVYLSDIGVAPYVSYSESFLSIVGTNAFGKAFESETGQQYEIGVKYQPPGAKSFVTVAAFDLRRQNVLTPDPTNPFNQVQTGEVRSRGVELEAVASLAAGLNLVASYTYQDVEVTRSNAGDEGKRPVNVPEHIASLWADYTIQGGSFRGFGFGGGIRYIGSTFGDADNTLKVPGYTLADAAIHYEWRAFRFAVNAKNIFDDEHVTSCISANACVYGTGRTVIGSVGYRW